MATSSKRTYAIPTPRAPVPVADHCRPEPPQDMLKHSSVSVSVGSLGPGVHKVCLSPLSISGCSGTGFDSQCKFTPATVLLLMVERSDRMWSTREGNGKPLQYSCLENPMNNMKSQNDRILKKELPRSVGAQYATGDQ